jgi:hypothetical protein
MAWKFDDVDLKAHLHMQAEWDQAFVDQHFHVRRGLRGQRKLLMSNLLAVTLAVEDMQKQNDTRKLQLVIAGASPGIHLPVLIRHLQRSNIADRLEIHLFDPKPLHRSVAGVVRASENVRFTHDLFKDSDALAWGERDTSTHCLLFLSDIRSEIHGKKQHSRMDEEKIDRDMHMQKKWVETMQPDYSMLKFHAPHATPDNPNIAASFSYVAGDLYKQTDTDLFSAELRLFVKKADIKDTQYSTTGIERHMFFHNQTLRPTTFSVLHGSKLLQFDDAFEQHVAQRAGRVLKLNANLLLSEASAKLPVDPIHFTWTPRAYTRLQGMIRTVQKHV